VRAWADPGGIAPVVDCVILDIAEGGVRVTALHGTVLPDAFRLQLDSARRLGDAEVVWRNGAAVGARLAAPGRA